LNVKINKSLVLQKRFLREFAKNPENEKFYAHLGGAVFGYFFPREKVTYIVLRGRHFIFALQK